MLRFQKLTKKYGEKVAVRELDLEVFRGELFVFLGPNGAGKTTTIKMLTGLIFPTSGNIQIRGMDIVERHLEIKKILAYVPDEPYLYDKLTGREFLRFVAQMYGIDSSVAEAKIEELAGMFGAKDYLDQLCETYSHGMKQRVVIAAMLLHSPEIAVIDEPMVGLDPQSARLFKDIMREMTARGGTIFMSTHSLHVAQELADRIGIIQRGRLVALGTFEQLQRRFQAQEKNLEELFLEITATADLEE
ncbi:MAG: ABC transporter ATP-binding protein [Planctomycetota bacterium]|nr:MAG: ABC transporter ATP-binding protein [Planctomycetota bacterium]